ncbi:Protein ABSCISIC ACID-INSENSITIVE 5 [Auxenochlorella protothecoides]|uniref:Protein ABSCISIC ACID-INSENSITIVE 5 n=1 Tax=Auxenochlorella protothecoides TaxID=3075 RepID=A0A087SKZ9_AUXPR|nr:Protein ABSCISIC ACID-INSENSITIVE 5 [Auxenochlorella protothecoides]KFM26403.1 Protein ABSCISIC ACID-INSENSITIVE 5 [Auxenochlorella protothecoides]
MQGPHARRKGRKKVPPVDLARVEDPEERKRQRRLMKNRETAAASRARRQERELLLEDRIRALEQENACLKAKLSSLGIPLDEPSLADPDFMTPPQHPHRVPPRTASGSHAPPAPESGQGEVKAEAAGGSAPRTKVATPLARRAALPLELSTPFGQAIPGVGTRGGVEVAGSGEERSADGLPGLVPSPPDNFDPLGARYASREAMLASFFSPLREESARLAASPASLGTTPDRPRQTERQLHDILEAAVHQNGASQTAASLTALLHQMVGGPARDGMLGKLQPLAAPASLPPPRLGCGPGLASAARSLDMDLGLPGGQRAGHRGPVSEPQRLRVDDSDPGLDALAAGRDGPQAELPPLGPARRQSLPLGGTHPLPPPLLSAPDARPQMGRWNLRLPQWQQAPESLAQEQEKSGQQNPWSPAGLLMM